MSGKVIGLAVATLVVFITGVVLTRGGRPYGGGLLNGHKLVDLAAVVVLGYFVYQAQRASTLSDSGWALIATAAVFAVATFATGGVLSAMSEPPAWVLWFHRIGSWFAGALVVASGYAVLA